MSAIYQQVVSINVISLKFNLMLYYKISYIQINSEIQQFTILKAWIFDIGTILIDEIYFLQPKLSLSA